MDEPQMLAVIIVAACFAVAFFGGWYLIHRTMNRPDAYIGAKMVKREEEMRRQQEGSEHLLPNDPRADLPPNTNGTARKPDKPDTSG